MIHTPRITGDVVVPLAVTLSMLAWVMRPPQTGILRERDLAHGGARHSGHAVELSQAFIEESEIGIDDGPRRKVFSEQLLNEEPGLFHGGELERVVEFVVVIQSGGGRSVVDLAEIEPVVCKGVDEAAGLRVVEQAVGLGPENVGIVEPARRGKGTELFVRWGVPQEKGETSCAVRNRPACRAIPECTTSRVR